MGRPLNKRLFGADQFNNLKCQFNAGTGSVRGYIVKQLGTRTFLCEDESGNTAICRMVVKASADIAPGEMTFTLAFDDSTVVHPTKISQNLVTVNGFQMPWDFSINSSDGVMQMEEAGYNPQMDGATDLEGDDVELPSWLTWAPRGNLTERGVNFGWTANSIWFDGDAGNNDPSFPIFTNFTIPTDQSVEINYSFPYTHCNDIAVCVYRDTDSPPEWHWGSNSTRISAQHNCQGPEIQGLSDGAEGYGGGLQEGNSYWTYIKYDPSFAHSWDATLHSEYVTITGNVASVGSEVTDAAIAQANIPFNRGNNIPRFSMVSVTFGNIVGGTSTAIGFMNPGDTYDGSLGDTISNSVAWQASEGCPGFPDSPTPGPAFGSNNTIDIAVDRDYHKAWIRVNGGDWWGGNGYGGGNPNDGLSQGYSIGTINGGPIYLAAQLFNDGVTGDSITVNSSNAYPIPDGYTFLGNTGRMTFDTRDGDQVQFNQAVWHEKLLPGAYRVGFSADQDNMNDRATLYNLNVLVNGSTLYTYGS